MKKKLIHNLWVIESLVTFVNLKNFYPACNSALACACARAVNAPLCV